MSPQVQLGAGLYAFFGLLLLLEGAWVTLGAGGLENARDWAAMHGPHGANVLLGGGVCFMGVAWSLLRGRRWAWLVAVVSGAVWTIPGLAGLSILLAVPQGAAWAREHRVEAGLGVVSVVALLGSLIALLGDEARDQFRRRSPGRAGGQAV